MLFKRCSKWEITLVIDDKSKITRIILNKGCREEAIISVVEDYLSTNPERYIRLVNSKRID